MKDRAKLYSVSFVILVFSKYRLLRLGLELLQSVKTGNLEFILINR